MYQELTPSPDLDTDSDNDGDLDADDDGIEEAAPGRLVPLNDDDDNANDTADYEEQPIPQEDDLAKLMVRAKPAVTNGELCLRMLPTDGKERIRLWLDPQKTTELVLDEVTDGGALLHWEAGVPLNGEDLTLYVEGVALSTDPGDVTLRLVAKLDDGTPDENGETGTYELEDRVRCTVFGADLDVGAVPDEMEVLGGGILGRNDDDDNGDGWEDRFDPGEVAGEDDLLPLHLSLRPASLSAGQAILGITSGAGKVKVWESPLRQNIVADLMTKTWDLSAEAMPPTLWLEGAEASEQWRDATVRLQWNPVTGLAVSHGDEVCATVVLVDLDCDADHNGVVDDADDADEGTLPGQVFGVNGDNDNDNYIENTTIPITDCFEMTDPVTGEDDLVRLPLAFRPGTPDVGTVELSRSGSAVFLWKDKEKGDSNKLLVGGDTLGVWPVAEFAQFADQIWAEGYETSECSVRVEYKDADGGIVAEDEVYLTVLSGDISATDLDGAVFDWYEEAPGAFVHFNVDNDNDSDNTVGAPKHPGGDYLEADPVDGEDDLAQATLCLEPVPEAGQIRIRLGNANGKAWDEAIKGQDDFVVAGAGSKVWDLADLNERAQFLFDVADGLWIEGVDLGECTLFLEYLPPGASSAMLLDEVKYTFIAADCGNQPKSDGSYAPFKSERDHFEQSFPDLKRCQWSVTDPDPDGNYPDNRYNCIAWSVGDDQRQLNPWDIDRDYGNNDGIFQTADMDAFYLAERNWSPVATGPADAQAIYYPMPTDWDYTQFPNDPPTPGYHAAARSNCGCGAGRWHMFESKCGPAERIEHRWNQIDGPEFGDQHRFYK